MTKLSGTAISIAITVERMVPKMLLAAPKLSRTGSHAADHRKPQPNLWIERCERYSRTTNSPAITTSTNPAQVKAAARNRPSATRGARPCARRTIRPRREGGRRSGGRPATIFDSGHFQTA